MNSIDFTQSLIANPELLNFESLSKLRTIVEKYPYFHVARMLLLQNLFVLHDSSFHEELHRCAILIPDRQKLFNLIEQKNYQIETITSPVPLEEKNNLDRTESLIDNFLSTCKEEPRNTKKVTIDAKDDYMGFLLQQENRENEETLGAGNLLEGLIQKKTTKKSLKEKPEYLPEVAMRVDGEEKDTDKEFFTETLAKIYIKQGKYEKAIEIIKTLNAKYPKKNIYFADQLRFLQKIMINNQHKK